MPCDRPLVKCSHCGEFVTESEWADNGAPASELESDSEGISGMLADLLLAGERHQFCSQACKRAFDAEKQSAATE